MSIILEFVILSTCLLLGSIIKHFIDYPIPETVYGMAILFLALKAGIVKPDDIDRVSTFLVACLTFFFVPNLVQLMNEFSAMAPFLFGILATTTISISLTIVAVAKTVEFLRKLTGGGDSV